MAQLVHICLQLGAQALALQLQRFQPCDAAFQAVLGLADAAMRLTPLHQGLSPVTQLGVQLGADRLAPQLHLMAGTLEDDPHT